MTYIKHYFHPVINPFSSVEFFHNFVQKVQNSKVLHSSHLNAFITGHWSKTFTPTVISTFYSVESHIISTTFSPVSIHFHWLNFSITLRFKTSKIQHSIHQNALITGHWWKVFTCGLISTTFSPVSIHFHWSNFSITSSKKYKIQKYCIQAI